MEEQSRDSRWFYGLRGRKFLELLVAISKKRAKGCTLKKT